KPLLTVRRELGEFERVRFADAGKTVVVVGRDQNKLCDLWRIDVATGKVSERVTVAATVPEPARGRFSPDGSRLARGGGAGEAQQRLVLGAATGKIVWRQGLVDETPGGFPFAPDGKTVAVSTSTGRVYLFDSDGKPAGMLTAAKARLSTVGISPDG